MNTNYKCNCCAKESVCKYSVEYKQDCGAILSAICGKTTDVQIVCSEFAPIVPTVKEKEVLR